MCRIRGISLSMALSIWIWNFAQHFSKVRVFEIHLTWAKSTFLTGRSWSALSPWYLFVLILVCKWPLSLCWEGQDDCLRRPRRCWKDVSFLLTSDNSKPSVRLERLNVSFQRKPKGVEGAHFIYLQLPQNMMPGYFAFQGTNIPLRGRTELFLTTDRNRHDHQVNASSI